MRRLFSTALLVLGASVAISGTAISADLPLKAPVAALPSWTGIYLGVHGGGAYSDVNFFVPASPTNIAGGCTIIAACPANYGSHTATGGLVGGQVGVNYQSGMWLIGMEAEAAWTNLKGGAISALPLAALASISDNSKIDGIFDVTARAGILAGRALFFAKGGAAWARATYWTATPAGLTTNVSDTRMGWIAGVGAEYEFHGPWTAKLEYDYIDFGRRRETSTLIGSTDFDIKQNVHLVKLGVNYRFSGR